MNAGLHAAPIAATIVPDLSCCPCCGQPRQGGAVMDAAARVATAQFRVSLRELKGPFRSQALADARSLVVWALRALGPGMSYPAIGLLLGGRDHSTVMNSHKRALRLRLENPIFAAACATVAFQLRNEEVL